MEGKEGGHVGQLMMRGKRNDEMMMDITNCTRGRSGFEGKIKRIIGERGMNLLKGGRGKRGADWFWSRKWD